MPAPIAPTPQPRDYLDTLIRVAIMPGLMHGMSAPRMSKSKCESRSAERHNKRGGAAVPVTIYYNLVDFASYGLQGAGCMLTALTP